jgi:SAM-dependent methyltransferase
MECPLCQRSTCEQRQLSPQFYNCNTCGTTFRHSSYYLSSEKEKERYLQHNNDVEDTSYQAFVTPIINEVCRSFNSNNNGLDFGAGTGPVISKLLMDKGYQMSLWDPFFHSDESVLNNRYDFIVCCETIEHFHNPLEEFELMITLLKPGGKLCCMSELLPKDISFNDWYYKNDPTHVIFYSEENLKWIKENVGFSEVRIDGRLIVFEI